MAEGKNKVIVYKDWNTIFSKLTDAEAGKLIKHFFKYINDEDPTAPNRLVELTFEPIKQTLKRDLRAWEKKSLKNSENAKERWNKIPKDANASERINEYANHADRDSVRVTDKVTVSDTDTQKSESVITRTRENIFKIFNSLVPASENGIGKLEFELVKKYNTALSKFAADGDDQERVKIRTWFVSECKKLGLQRLNRVFEMSEKYYVNYSSSGWKDANRNEIVDLKASVEKWIKNEKK